MFVIFRVKKLLMIFAVFILGVVTFFNMDDVSLITTNAGVNSNFSKIIVVDAGHGEPDGGAVGIDGTKEAGLNLAVAMKLKDALETNGYSVIMTREDENDISSKTEQRTISQTKASDLNNRVDIINNSNADIAISIHMNKYTSSSAYGWQTFYHKDSASGKKLAELIQTEIKTCVNRENKRVSLPIKDIKIINKSSIPVVLVECGFLSNQEDLDLLKSEEYQNKLVEGILNGINKHYQTCMSMY